MTLTLLFREYCHLCHQMLDELQVFKQQYGFGLDIIPIDDFPEWEALYDEKVPVLLHGQNEICYWHLDKAALTAFLKQHSCLKSANDTNRPVQT